MYSFLSQSLNCFFDLPCLVLGRFECAFQFLRCVSRYIASNTIIISQYSNTTRKRKAKKKIIGGTRHYNSVPTTARIQADARMLHIWLAYEKAIIEIYADTHTRRNDNNNNNFIPYLFWYALSLHTNVLHAFHFYELFYDYIANWLNSNAFNLMYGNIYDSSKEQFIWKTKQSSCEHCLNDWLSNWIMWIDSVRSDF